MLTMVGSAIFAAVVRFSCGFFAGEFVVDGWWNVVR
jgi:hypothetical protein